jgi:hypothetical protein
LGYKVPGLTPNYLSPAPLVAKELTAFRASSPAILIVTPKQLPTSPGPIVLSVTCFAH